MNPHESRNYSGRFPSTHHSAIEALRSDAPDERARAFDTIVAAYWKPVYKFVRVRYRQDVEDARDLTQGFFLRVLEKDFFAGYDSSRARFRTFLRTCLERFVANEFRAENRQKRGGGAEHLSLDFADAEKELQLVDATKISDIDRYFEREWVRSVLGMALSDLRRWAGEEGKEIHWRLFERYDLQRDESDGKVSYDDLAEEMKISITDVTNYLAAIRRQFRETVLAIIRDLTTNDAEYREEVRAVLGIDPS